MPFGRRVALLELPSPSPNCTLKIFRCERHCGQSNELATQSLPLTLCLFHCLSPSLSFPLSQSVFPSVCLSDSVSICLSLCHAVPLSLCHSVCLPFCLSVCLFDSLFVCLFLKASLWPLCLSLCLFLCLSIPLSVSSLTLSLSFCLFVCHYVSMSVRPSVCLTVALAELIKPTGQAENGVKSTWFQCKY